MVRLNVVDTIAGLEGGEGDEEGNAVRGAGLRWFILEFDRHSRPIAVREPDANRVASPDTHHVAHFPLHVDLPQRRGNDQVHQAQPENQKIQEHAHTVDEARCCGR